MKIVNGTAGYEPRRLKAPFGFKGGHITELWQTAVSLDSGAHRVTGLGTQSVLWSDSAVFGKYGEAEGNRLMFAITRYAVELLKNAPVTQPQLMLEDLFRDVYRYGQKITGHKALKKTFVLNALTPVDNALWLLYAHQKGWNTFDSILRGECHRKLLAIPLIAYNTGLGELQALLAEGAGLIKIKIGSDPHGDNDPRAMLEWDQGRLLTIHETARAYSSPYTTDGRVRYYLDANGRYPDKETLARFLEFAQQIGALERIEILEEPFGEDCAADISDLPVPIAMDESAHSLEDVRGRISLGYGVLALKPIAKTLSATLAMLDTARRHGLHCFCADLTVNPNLVQWNRNVAARLAPLPGLIIGAFESNGAQNYADWDTMKGYCPAYEEPLHALFTQDGNFWARGGGIFDICPHYSKLAKGG
jgi:L-alanine-DL-glutamate epimerase-like enolase superfamily enzyme